MMEEETKVGRGTEEGQTVEKRQQQGTRSKLFMTQTKGGGKPQMMSSHGTKPVMKATFYSSSQGKLLLEAMREKSVDLMKKSTKIHELLETHDVPVTTMCDNLYNDRFFRTGTYLPASNVLVVALNQSKGMFNSSKKFELFLLDRTEKKLAELTITSSLTRIFRRLYS